MEDCVKHARSFETVAAQPAAAWSLNAKTDAETKRSATLKRGLDGDEEDIDAASNANAEPEWCGVGCARAGGHGVVTVEMGHGVTSYRRGNTPSARPAMCSSRRAPAE
jgi:hypothetical protein